MLQNIYPVNKNDTTEIRTLLKENNIKASIKLGTNRWYILIDAKVNNEKTLSLIEDTGKFQAIGLVKESQQLGLLNISGQMMIEKVER